MTTKHDKVVSLREKLPPMNSHNPLNMWSRDKLKTLYLHYRSAYGHKIYQGGDIHQGAPSQKLPQLLNEVVM